MAWWAGRPAPHRPLGHPPLLGPDYSSRFPLSPDAAREPKRRGTCAAWRRPCRRAELPMPRLIQPGGCARSSLITSFAPAVPVACPGSGNRSGVSTSSAPSSAVLIAARLPSRVPSPDRHAYRLPAAGSAGAYSGSQADRTGGVAMPSEPTLLRMLITGRHWQKFETFDAQFKRAARELAAQDDEPRLRTVTVSPRQFERWYSGTVKTAPYPDSCRILEHMFGYPVQQLLAPAPDKVQQLTPDGTLGQQHHISSGIVPVR